MRKLRSLRWWGLFGLMPLTVALILLDDDAPMSQTWHLVFLAVTAAVICALAVAWAERNADLMEREGADALVGYRPLPGTLEAMDAMDAESAARGPLVAGRRRFVSGYDPLAFPPVGHSRPDDAAAESLS